MAQAYLGREGAADGLLKGQDALQVAASVLAGDGNPHGTATAGALIVAGIHADPAGVGPGEAVPFRTARTVGIQAQGRPCEGRAEGHVQAVRQEGPAALAGPRLAASGQQLLQADSRVRIPREQLSTQLLEGDVEWFNASLVLAFAQELDQGRVGFRNP